jgi:sterol desaturase/sphingolipid hydroxylase (fatty acid hydroxylase superfamily)
MDTYAAILLWVIPGFLVLVLIEILYGHYMKKQTYTLIDTISSLSSGITNILKDSMGIIFIIISYSFLEKKIALFQLESSLTLYILAFICIDFASYWSHRLNHKINIFWNQHIIHHSSEEFNLACALRQSISNIIGYNALFLIPAAIIGVPAEIIIILSPIHLFGQFWYHTQHIGKLGFLEYIFVTPSQHRVHHAINPIYIDKNLSAIFCIWDRVFGTFQEEIDNVKPIYGTLKPVQTWNPVIINFQHLFKLTKDSWYTKKFSDKIKIWFMPTGWRPKDVEKVFKYKTQLKKQKKYYPNYTNSYKILGIFQFLCVNTILTYFLYNFSNLEIHIKLIYTCIIFLSVFGYSSLMDNYSWAPFFEIFRSLLSLYLLNFVGELTIFKSFLFIYLFISIVISCLIIKKISPFLNE